MHGVGVDKGDLQAEEAGRGAGSISSAPAAVNSSSATPASSTSYGDVVHARPPLGEEAADRRVRAGRGEQFEPARADEDRGGLDPLVGDAVAVLERSAERGLCVARALVEVGDRDTNMVDALAFTTPMLLPAEGMGGVKTESMRPYSTASRGVMERSRSMSSITVDVAA